MLADSPPIINADWTNSINAKGIAMANKGIEIDREVLISNYTQDTITMAWNTLCQFVAQNYTLGKGTTIKGFGTFTFNNFEVNLEGTTNQYSRDFKQRTPVFIVSKELVETLSPGQYANNCIIYYTQKQNNSINHVKLNYAEIAYALNISRDECTSLWTNLIRYIGDSIRKNTFKNKEWPGVGTLIWNRNVIGVKFNEELIENSKGKPQKLWITKRNVHLSSDVSKSQSAAANEIKNPFKHFQNIRPNISVLTKIEKSGEMYMKNKYDIDIIQDLPKPEGKTWYRAMSQSQWMNFNFWNDKFKKKKTYEDGKDLLDMGLPIDMLESFEYFKGILMKNMKKYDYKNNGNIKIADCINAVWETKMNPKIDHSVAKALVKWYSKNSDWIDYMRFIMCLIKDAKIAVDNTRNKNDTNRSKNTRSSSVLTKQRTPGTIASTNSNSSNNLTINKSNLTSLKQKQIDADNMKKEISLILSVLPELQRKCRTTLDQKISCTEFCNILSQYSIVYPKDQILKLLSFIEIENPDTFSLSELENKWKNIKILSIPITSDEVIKIFNEIKDIIYLSGGKTFLFKNDKTTITSSEFIDWIKPKTTHTSEMLQNVFNYLVKTNRDFTINDYNHYIEKERSIWGSDFEVKALKEISNAIIKLHWKTDEYFDHWLKYNINTKNKVITRADFINIIKKEKFNFNAEEIDFIFSTIDYKHDDVIDREEFVSKVTYVSHPLSILQNIIKRDNWDIEDIVHRMTLDRDKNERMPFEKFLDKIKWLDYTWSREFITSLFNTWKNKGCEYVESSRLIEELDMARKDFIKTKGKSKYTESFTKWFKDTVKNKVTFNQLKAGFELDDQFNNGLLEKGTFVKAMERFIKEFTGEEIIKFVRIINMIDNKAGMIHYPSVLDYIYFEEKEDHFTHWLELLKHTLISKFHNNLTNFFWYINHTNKVMPITTQRMSQYIATEWKDNSISNKIICKLDIDADGLISYDDWRGVIERYNNTSFFKFENNESSPQINWFSPDKMTDDKFKLIVTKIKQYMKLKNITETGWFHKWDKDNDGFISNIDFNTEIDSILKLAPAIKDQFFNVLDYYHSGLVDWETFIFKFKDFTSSSILPKNNNTIENVIINEFSSFINKNKQLCDTEIFTLIDKDCDGVANLHDFKHFIINSLQISKYDINDYKIERVMQALSLSKNNQIGLNDIKEFIDKSKSMNGINKYHINLKEIFKVTNCQNLSPNKENIEWTNEIIERFGMYVSEKYDSVKHFFEQNHEMGSNKFKYEDFYKFHMNNFECFNNGFNLSKDELLAVYTSLDSQKKKFLTLEDLENKLQVFDFYKKMHIDVRTFWIQNFNNGVDAFKFFIRNNNKIPNHMTKEEMLKSSLTKKEVFDAVNYFFPKKYPTQTILKYITKNFRNAEEIHFRDFNYVYFNGVANNESFIRDRTKETSLLCSRHEILKNNNELSKSQGSFKPTAKTLETPFDNDPLNKIKRIIQSTKVNLEDFFDAAKKSSWDNMVNKYQFRDMIKAWDIGLTNWEIDDIMKKSGMTYDGKINIMEFITFLKGEDKNLITGRTNTTAVISEIKNLIYKYYSNPIICFQSNDINSTSRLDFEQFKQIVIEIFRRDHRKPPNFTMLKNAFDILDLRKDGIWDMNEWMKTFGSINGSWDKNKELIDNGFDFFTSKNRRKSAEHYYEIENRKALRQWESSNDVCDIYRWINKNRKWIQQSLREYVTTQSGPPLVQSENLINLLKSILPKMKLNHTQWKMLVLVAKSGFENWVDLNTFFKMVEMSAKNYQCFPKKRK